MLMAALSEQADLLQAAADRLPGLDLADREREAKRTISEAEAEGVNDLGVGDATLLQIVESGRRLLQGVVVVGNDMGEDFLVVEIGMQIDFIGHDASPGCCRKSKL
jgi:hypothetical protein